MYKCTLLKKFEYQSKGKWINCSIPHYQNKVLWIIKLCIDNKSSEIEVFENNKQNFIVVKLMNLAMKLWSNKILLVT